MWVNGRGRITEARLGGRQWELRWTGYVGSTVESMVEVGFGGRGGGDKGNGN